MAKTRTDCPGDQELSAFAQGKLPSQAIDRMQEHLESCPSCMSRLDRAPDGSFIGKLRPRSDRTVLPARAAVVQPATTAELPDDLGRLGKYQLIARLGQGGMGTVYRAHDADMGRDVALKLITMEGETDPELLDRFRTEVKAAAQLEHPNIVRAYHAELKGEQPYLVMELIDGRNLHDHVKKVGPLPVEQACNFARQAALGLAAAHKKGLIHRDIKPHNLMVTRKGEVKILDFGLAKLTTGRKTNNGATMMGQMMGTPEYLAPEQSTNARDVDARADQYSLGCTLYFLLAGRPPFQGGSAMDVILAHHQDTCTPLTELRPGIPAGLAEVVAKMMARRRDDRYASLDEVVKELRPFLTSTGATQPTPKVAPATAVPVAVPMPISRAMVDPLALDDATEPTPRVQRAQRRKQNGGWNPLLVYGGAVAGALTVVAALWLVITLVLKTTDGKAEVEIKVDQPGCVVSVDELNITIKTKGEDKPIKVKVVPGKEYTLRVEKDGFVTETKSFTYRKDKKWIEVKLTRQPQQDPDPVPDPKQDSTPPPPPVPSGPRANEYTNSLGMRFALVPKGKAWLGGGNDMVGTTEVEFTEDFYLGVYEVTQGEWQKVMGSNPSCFFPGGKNEMAVRGIRAEDLERFPVENVSWQDAQKFLAVLNARDKVPGWEYRLPTVNQWEYACRGGPMTAQASSRFDYYLDKPGLELLANQANFKHATSLGRPCKIGSYAANSLGIHDMHGNILEWCDETWAGTGRLFRGGCWSDLPNCCTAAFSFGTDAGSRENYLGLRVARLPVKTSPKAIPEEAETGFTSLFNGKDLNGWSILGTLDRFEVDPLQQLIKAKPSNPVTRLESDKNYANFHLKFEFRIAMAASTSGVYLRMPPGSKGVLPAMKVQVRDDSTPYPASQTGGIYYGIRNPVWFRRERDDLLHARGEWNRLEVIARGPKVRVLVNDKQALDADLQTITAPNAIPEVRRAAGRITFDADRGEIWYRKIEIKELPGTE